MEGWVTLENYPGYSVSDLGQVRNDRRNSVLAIVATSSGHVFVGLVRNGFQVKRSVAKLVSDAFIPRPPHQPHFNTPIHLDGDLSNCRVDNLAWRPRWFAMRFTQQFKRDQPSHPPIRNKITGEEFQDCWPLVKRHGLLYSDIVLATVNCSYVFPTMQTFEWVL